MKTILKQFLKYYLKFFTKLVLFVHRPTVIGIAGSINKTFAKGIVKKTLLDAGLSARSNQKNFNTEIGLPLAVLNLPSGYSSFKDWVPTILKAPLVLFGGFPKFLVLSLGTSDPGDIKYLLSIIKPKIVVVTDITQRYIEGFRYMDKMQNEYVKLVKKIKNDGLLIYNNDNERIKTLKKVGDCQKVGFGFSEDSDYKIVSKEKRLEGQVLSFRDANQKTHSRKISRHGDHHLYNQLISEIISDYVVSGQKK